MVSAMTMSVWTCPILFVFCRKPAKVLCYSTETGKVQKCDLCIGRTQAGQKPACIETCPMDALVLMSMDTAIEGE